MHPNGPAAPDRSLCQSLRAPRRLLIGSDQRDMFLTRPSAIAGDARQAVFAETGIGMLAC